MKSRAYTAVFFLSLVLLLPGCSKSTTDSDTPLDFIAKDGCDAYLKTMRFALEIHYDAAKATTEQLQTAAAALKQQNCDKEAVTKALKRDLARLDPHSTYYDPQQAAIYDGYFDGRLTQTRGFTYRLSAAQRYLLKLQEVDRAAAEAAQRELTPAVTFGTHWTVSDVLPTSAAEQAGVMPGDAIESIDALTLTSENWFEAQQLLLKTDRNRFRIRPANGGETREIDLARASALQPSVMQVEQHNDILYIKLANFVNDGVLHADAAKALEVALENAFKSSEPVAIILDLRGNLGGFNSAAVDVVSLFTNAKNVVCLETRQPITTTMRTYNIKPQCYSGGLPTIVPPNIPVLVINDASTASAAELTALALQTAQRAVVVGERSFGKGSAYLTFRLSQRTIIGGLLNVTSAIYKVRGKFTPQSVGVIPDEALTDVRVADLMQRLRRLKPELVFREEDYGAAVIRVGAEAVRTGGNSEFNAVVARLAAASRAKRTDCTWDQTDCTREWAQEWAAELTDATQSGELAWGPVAPPTP